jgi:hypothetical protein
MDYRQKTKKFITNYGSYDVKSITAVRTPILKLVNFALNAVSFGKLNDLKKKYGHDKLFHLGIIVELNDNKNTRLIIEKLEKVNIEFFNESYIKKNSETVNVPMNYKKVSLYDLLNNARRKFGDYRFFSYDGTGYSGSTNNCQDFIIMMLDASGLGDPSSKSFIKQDLDQLLNKLSKTTHKIAKGVTDLANKATSYIGLGYESDENESESDCSCDCHKMD